MLGFVIAGGVLAGVGYLSGTVLHELSHVAAVITTGSTLERVQWRQTLIEYDPVSGRADAWIKATPTLLTPVLVVSVVLSVHSLWSFVFALGVLSGFIPRDLTEWLSLTQL